MSEFLPSKYLTNSETLKLCDGLWGINCSHQPDPFIPGWSESERPVQASEGNARYEQTQKQRHHEQQVKKWKRSAVAAEATGDTEAYEAASAKVREQQAALNDYCEKTGLPFLDNRTQVFGYNKGLSGKATAAVRKPVLVTAGGKPVTLVKKTDIHSVPNSETQEIVKKATSIAISMARMADRSGKSATTTTAIRWKASLESTESTGTIINGTGIY